MRRSPAGNDEIEWDPGSGTLGALEGFDAAVHLSGAGIGGARWTKARKALLRTSRIDTTSMVASALANAAAPPSVFVSASAIGYYGDRGDEVLTEASSAGSDFLAQLCVDWESATAPADAAGIRVVHLRTGLVLDGGGGLLAPLLPLFRAGLGGTIGRGDQWMSWIAIDDHVGAVVALLDGDVAGPVNLVAPNPVTNRQFTAALGSAVSRPTFLTIPRVVIEARLGRAAAAGTAFASQRVAPAVLEAAGFRFQFSDVDQALHHVLARPTESPDAEL